MRTFLLLLALVLTSVLSGCAGSLSARTSSPPANFERSLSGRISVQYEELAGNREETLHGRFEWLETDSQIEVSLLDPLGQTVALLTTATTTTAETLSTTTLRLRDGKTYQGSTPEDLSEQVLGWRLPVRGLRSWLNGEAIPGVTTREEKTNEGRLLQQDGWSIRYLDAASSTANSENDAQKPKRINFDYPGPPVRVEIKLIIDERTP